MGENFGQQHHIFQGREFEALLMTAEGESYYVCYQTSPNVDYIQAEAKTQTALGELKLL